MFRLRNQEHYGDSDEEANSLGEINQRKLPALSNPQIGRRREKLKEDRRRERKVGKTEAWRKKEEKMKRRKGGREKMCQR